VGPSPAPYDRCRSCRPPPTDTPHRCPPESIPHAVWRRCRLRLRDREVEARRGRRGIMVTDDVIRTGCGPCSHAAAPQRRRRRPQSGANWHHDKVVSTLQGGRHDRWRAVAQDEHVATSGRSSHAQHVRPRRHTSSAKPTRRTSAFRRPGSSRAQASRGASRPRIMLAGLWLVLRRVHPKVWPQRPGEALPEAVLERSSGMRRHASYASGQVRAPPWAGKRSSDNDERSIARSGSCRADGPLCAERPGTRPAPGIPQAGSAAP
jgi:hypothetical protein